MTTTITDHDSVDETPGDEALLSRLRDGDTVAYDVLWAKHIGAALRLGHRLAPGRGEDLASEAFLAVYRQVTTTASGPTSAFRAYLFTVMRNTAKKWRLEQQSIDVFADIEQVDEDDALKIVEEQAEASELLDAFRALPERWQRVLWLVEVEGAKRAAIAADLGIRPNAVSSLQRRARAGLREQWLTRLVPAQLRDDPQHVGALVPSYVLGSATSKVVRAVDAHSEICDACADVITEVRASSVRIKRTTLSAVGFAALGSAVSVSSPIVPAVAIGGAALMFGGAGLGLGAIGTIAAGSLAVITVGSLAVGLLDSGGRSSAADADVPSTKALSTQVLPPENGKAAADEDRDGTGSPAPKEPEPPGQDSESAPDLAPETGRHNTDPDVPDVDVSDRTSGDGWAYPDSPDPAPTDSVPDPRPDDSSTGGTDDDPTDDPPPVVEAPLSPGLSTPSSSTVYLAPVIAGATRPDAQVTVEYEGDRYLPDIAPDGSWTFDFRRLNTYGAGTYTYRVWAFTADDQSISKSGTFDVIPIVVDGFTDPQEVIPLDEASTTGVTISIQGPANGRVCLSEMSGASTEIPLDENGRTVGRIVVQEAFWYMFTLFACAPMSDASGSTATYFGASVEGYLNAEDPDVLVPSPWGPGPEAVTFDFPEP
ncbi:RNA polymerase sigma factor [Microbacterium halotolerans]|uniref:RNA polymerase sigma factor n=1 Tax=Microbacterium halotolerans TaxID=246613 RepID=UPI000E6ABF3E|nr:sigma-70 family RNA polymerase sigma factor [Microbacterium halotolerans]